LHVAVKEGVGLSRGRGHRGRWGTCPSGLRQNSHHA